MKCLIIGAPLLSDGSNEQDKLLVIICLVLLLMFLPQRLFGQNSGSSQKPLLLNILSSSRMEINPAYQFMPTSDTHEAWLHLARTIPMGIDRPSLSLQSRISLLHGSIGIRMNEEMEEEVRWSAGLLNGSIYRAPIAVGLTILNYDRIGQYDLEARWFGIHVGPAVRLESEWVAIEPRLVGSVGGSSLRPGTATFANLGTQARHTVHGLDAGYEAELPARLSYWLLLSVGAGQRTVVGDRNLFVTRGKVEAQAVLTRTLQVYARYQLKRVKMRDQSDTARAVRMGLRLWL